MSNQFDGINGEDSNIFLVVRVKMRNAVL